jgi:AraC-like DNA-binding protein
MQHAKKDLKFQYNEILPSEEISHLAFCLFEFKIEGDFPAPIPHEVFPDGCISLMYRHNERLNLKLLLLKGLSLETFHTEVFAGDILWGVKFSPALCEKILRCDPKDIPTQPILDDRLLPHLTTNLSDKLIKCNSFKESILIFEEKLQNLEIKKAEVDVKIADAVKLIEDYKGEAKISEIAKAVDLSTRQLERRFRKNSGLTPKQFSRVCRFRATAINLIETDMNWANRAAELGFTDQAHLTRELSSLTGRSPKSFEKKIKDVDYDDLIK